MDRPPPPQLKGYFLFHGIVHLHQHKVVEEINVSYKKLRFN